jgi:hypothetical protein
MPQCGAGPESEPETGVPLDSVGATSPKGMAAWAPAAAARWKRALFTAIFLANLPPLTAFAGITFGPWAASPGSWSGMSDPSDPTNSTLLITPPTSVNNDGTVATFTSVITVTSPLTLTMTPSGWDTNGTPNLNISLGKLILEIGVQPVSGGTTTDLYDPIANQFSSTNQITNSNFTPVAPAPTISPGVYNLTVTFTSHNVSFSAASTLYRFAFSGE